MVEEEESVYTVTIQVDEKNNGKIFTVLITDQNCKFRFVHVLAKDGAVEFETGVYWVYYILDGHYRIVTFVDLPFLDVNTHHWFYDSVAYSYVMGLVKGTAANMFSPNMKMTRAMFATILYIMSGEAGDSDDEGEYWYTNAVAWAVENRIILGYGGGRFGEHDNVTREQMVTILYRFAKYMGYDTDERADMSGINDKDKISDWAVEAFEWAVGVDIIRGVKDTELNPKGSSTRAQIATVIQRFGVKFGEKILVVDRAFLAE